MNILENNKIIKSFAFGEAMVTGVIFENPDGTPVLFNRDYFNESREEDRNAASPFVSNLLGKNTIKLWPK